MKVGSVFRDDDGRNRMGQVMRASLCGIVMMETGQFTKFRR